MQLSGNLRKMRVVHEDPVAYFLRMGDEEIALNPLVGEHLSLRFSGHIHCTACGREINKSFNQGYCFPCFRSLAQCDRCMVSPELCHFHLGTCREPDWGLAHCMQPHVVYLANTSGIKVGITRATQVPTRWIDQGAVQALPLMNVTSRRASGVVETALKSHMADRTDWRRMLKGPPESADRRGERNATSGARRRSTTHLRISGPHVPRAGAVDKRGEGAAHRRAAPGYQGSVPDF
jgi:hypothetical protein